MKKYLSETHQELSKEWGYAKNGNLRPEDFTYGSHKKVWWFHYDKKGNRHEWQAFIYSRTDKVKPTGCPVCANKVVTETNNLAVLFPELSKEWDRERNKIGPGEIVPGSHKKVWWVCKKCDHSWKAFIYSRTDKVRLPGCPACGKEKRSKSLIVTKIIKNGSLSKTHPHLMEEWDREKNIVNPEEITPGSKKKVWWFHYDEDGNRHEWQAVINNRTKKENPAGCPICNAGPVSKISQKWLDLFNTPQEFREFYIKDLGFRVDGFDPKTNTAYEFLGDYWHGNPKIFSPEKINPTNKKSYGQLHQETMERIDILKENNYKVIYIWENDFRRIGSAQ